MRVTVSGAGGFIGGHLVNRLVNEGYEVRAVDIKKFKDWNQINLNAISLVADCSDPRQALEAVTGSEWVFNLAADMGGMGFIETHRALCAEDVLTTLTMIQAAESAGVARYFYASSACVYPADAQVSPDVIPLAEHMAIPAEPEAGYGWAKLYGELLARYFWEDYGLETRTARFHNIYGTDTAYQGGREKAPAAVCRKVAHAAYTGDTTVEVWGDGEQTRSFCWVDDCVEGILRLMASDVTEPLNIGSDELVTINGLYEMVAEHAGVKINLAHDLDAPQGVRGRNSDNELIKARLGWAPSTPLAVGMAELYDWVAGEVAHPAT
jgi:GDP-D-mannose 3',5'-epimerase